MPHEWDKKGCTVCRRLWREGKQPPKIGIDEESHAFLHRCDACGVYWEQFERYADTISFAEAKEKYGIEAVTPRES